MKTLGKFLFASAGFLALVLMLALTDSGRAIAQTAAPLRVVLEGIAQIAGDVRITNAADSPVETRVNGPIQIASSPRIPVLAKASLLVSDTFQKQVTITLQPGQLNGTASFGVPASRLLKIESFSGFVQGQPLLPLVRFTTTANGDPGVHFVVALIQSGGWLLTTSSAGISQAYADPGSTVEVFFQRTPLTSTTMTLTFTGHYIDQ